MSGTVEATNRSVKENGTGAKVTRNTTHHMCPGTQELIDQTFKLLPLFGLFRVVAGVPVDAVEALRNNVAKYV
ncbi:MAG TPA: hypothetical protein VN666_05595 [Nitrospira sp.]|nr:hypothetical protein [Nitrospira sp.]